MKPKVYKNSKHSPGVTHLLSVLLLRHNLRLFCSLLPFLQPGKQLLAHLHRCAKVAAQLISLLCQGCAEYSSGGLRPLLLLQGGAQPLDLLVLFVVRLTPDALQLQLLLSEVQVQPLDLLGGGQGDELHDHIMCYCMYYRYKHMYK